MIALGNDSCRAVSVGGTACVGVYVGDAMVFPDAPPTPTYDETKIAVIELDENDEVTDVVTYYDTPDEAKSYMYANYSAGKKYELRFGKNIATQHTITTSSWMQAFPGIVKLTVYSGLKNFYTAMFYNCPNLKEVYAENVGFDLESYSGINVMFGGCTSLAKAVFMDVPNYDSLNLSAGFFGGCTALKELTIEGTGARLNIGDGFASGIPALETVRITNAHNLNSNAFKELTSLKSAHIEWDDYNIGANAFDGCTNLERLTGSFPNGIQNFNNYCFRGCSTLDFGDMTITSSTNNISINDGAFMGCSGITSLTVNDTSGYQININDDAFNGCDGMTSVDITASGTIHLRERNFANCTALKDVTLTSGSGTFGGFYSNTFEGCDGITITINAEENSISGAPWGATDATVIWTG